MAHKYDFTVDWFKGQSAEISAFLAKDFYMSPRQGMVHQKYKVLEVGCYEGRSTVWWCDEYPGSRVVAIDSFKGGEEHIKSNVDMRGVMQRFYENIQPHRQDITVYESSSHGALAELVSSPNLLKDEGIDFFDLAYIDGSHMADDTMLDAMLASKLIKPGGLIIFDDYRWKDPRMPGPKFSPKLAVDSFGAMMRGWTLAYSGYIAIYKKDLA